MTFDEYCEMCIHWLTERGYDAKDAFWHIHYNLKYVGRMYDSGLSAYVCADRVVDGARIRRWER